MKRTLGPVGAGGLIWLVATACGETETNSDPSSPSTGSGDAGSTASTTQAGMATTDTGATGAGGTSSASCPDIEPVVGASCGIEGLSCSFTGCVAPNFRNDNTLTCLLGAWALTTWVECLPNCPDTSPDVGAPCDAQATPGPCQVSDPCDTALAYCVEGEWSQEEPGAAPEASSGAGGASDIVAVACPSFPEAFGTPCCPTFYPAYCDYSEIQTPAGAGGTGATGGTGAGDRVPVTHGTTGAQGQGAVGGTGATGGTGLFGPCMACDPERKVWTGSTACP